MDVGGLLEVMQYFCFGEGARLKHLLAGMAAVEESVHIWRSLNECELFLVTDGDEYIEQDGQRWHLQKGDYLLTEPGKLYGGYAPSTSQFHWLHFRYPAEDACFCEDPSGADFSFPQSGHLDSYDSMLVIDILIEQYFILKDKEAVTDSLLTALLRELSSLTHGIAAKSPKDKRFQPIMDYFSQNPYFNEVKDVKTMAEFFGYSERYLIYLFKKNIGISPLQYLITKKMQRAQELLANTDMTIKGIASVLHYDYYYFMRLFRKTTGMSPTQYRKAVIPDWNSRLSEHEN